MKTIIRKAMLDDAADINRLSVQLGYSYPQEATIAWLKELLQSDHDSVWVAETEGTVSGCMHLFRALRLESGIFAEIGGLVIDETQRGHGLGQRMVAQAEAWCREMNIGVLRVRSNVIREGAHRFYRNNGFKEIKMQKVFEINKEE